MTRALNSHDPKYLLLDIKKHVQDTEIALDEVRTFTNLAIARDGAKLDLKTVIAMIHWSQMAQKYLNTIGVELSHMACDLVKDR